MWIPERGLGDTDGISVTRYVWVYIYVYIYIYMDRSMDRWIDRYAMQWIDSIEPQATRALAPINIYIYIGIYIYIYG